MSFISSYFYLEYKLLNYPKLSVCDLKSFIILTETDILSFNIMYYSQSCSYCHKVFYVYESSKHRAAERLYNIIKKHLDEYNEDDKEYKYDDGLAQDSAEILSEMSETNEPPKGGYEN